MPRLPFSGKGRGAMTQSAKRLAATVAVLATVAALAYGGATWYVGLRIEQHVRAGHEHLAAYAARRGVPVRLHYQRGIGSARATSFIGPAPGSQGQPLRIEHHIHHGPLPGLRSLGLARWDSHMPLPQAERADAAATAATPPHLHLHLQGRLGWRGQARLHWSAPTWQWANAQGRWRIGAVALAQTIHPHTRRYHSQLQWQGLHWQSHAGHAWELGAVQGEDDYTWPAPLQHRRQGHSRYTVQHLRQQQPVSAHPHTPPPLHAQALTFTLNAQPSASDAAQPPRPALYLQAQAQAGALHATLGDGLESAGPAALALALRPIDLADFESLLPYLAPLLAAWAGQEDPAAALAQWPLAQQQRLHALSAALAARNLRLELERLDLHTPQGPLHLSAWVSAPALAAIDLAYLPYSLLPKLHASVHLRVPQALAEPWLHDLSELIAQGWFTHAGNAGNAGDRGEGSAPRLIETRWRYQGGFSTLNDRPFEPTRLEQWLR
ncbi:DUF945 family protein [Allofranklinella schreckenbergeri]|uniref:DUF945 family protein n=2 Tax=Allofranklinella schreckenbergeri TaxID=1076744 RepID=A0A3M6PWR6_9BURK|nr:DUF945 family protein [Allofranklinella schreckenbergeri]